LLASWDFSLSRIFLKNSLPSVCDIYPHAARGPLAAELLGWGSVFRGAKAPFIQSDVAQKEFSGLLLALMFAKAHPVKGGVGSRNS